MDVWKGEGVGEIQVRAFSLPKEGASEEEYEDAFAFSEKDAKAKDVPFRAAVADGATEVAFARRWARLLAEHFVAHGAAALAGRLPAAKDAWAEAVEARAGALPWYAAAKAEDGAFAALLGLTLRPAAEEKGAWQATAIGDCNLFHVREGGLLRAWPRAQAGAFDHRPALVPSRLDAQTPATRRAEGRFERGDAFVLATDAAAAWLLRIGPPEALRWAGPEAFAEAVRAARDEGTLENDDTTVVVLQLS